MANDQNERFGQIICDLKAPAAFDISQLKSTETVFHSMLPQPRELMRIDQEGQVTLQEGVDEDMIREVYPEGNAYRGIALALFRYGQIVNIIK